MSSYDPRAKGAKCDTCPLNECRVVPPEYGHGLTPDVIAKGEGIVILGEAPGEEEERTGRPFSGKSGEELDRTMHLAGLRRKDVLISNVLLCRPPKNRLKDLLTAIVKENKQKEKDYKEACKDAALMGFSEPERPVMKPSPIDCCRPRLMKEMEGFTNFITLGGTATKAITGTNASIMAIRGGLMAMDATENTTAKRVMPTVHPAFALRQPKYIHVLRNDFFKGVRWFKGVAVWQPPELIWHPTPDQIREYLDARKGKILAYDLETDGIEALTAKIRCLSIGDETTALAIAILSKEEGHQRFLSPEVEAETIAILKEYFEGPETKYGWNCLYAGTPVILGDGTSRPIDSLIREKYKGTVLGLDETTGEMVETPVLNWFRHREPGQKWVVIRRVGEKKHSRGLTLTPDHKVYTQRGWVRADEVVAGDYLYDKERLLYPDERAVLLGTLLGDSCALSMTSTSGAGKSAISVQESISQRPTARIAGCHTNPELSQQKVDWLGGFLNTTKPTTDNNNGYKPGTIAYPYGTSQCRQVGELAKKVYRDSRKRGFTVDVLEELGPEGMAWLYADDGFKGKGDLPGRRNSVRIATCGFTQEDLEVAKDWFSQQFGPVVVTKTKCLSFSIEATYNFCLYISPYLLPAARYKLPPPGPYGLGDWPEFVGAPKRRKCPLPVLVESVSPWTPPDEHSLSKGETRWCITTGTGNFFTGFGLVKNSIAYDATVLRSQWKIEVQNQIDGILLHKSAESEMPHGLGYVGSLYTEAPSWKTDRESGMKLAFGSETDEELLRYCAMDVNVTYKVLAPITELVQLRDQVKVFKQDSKVQEICSAMHEVGMYVDQNKRLYFEKKMLKRRHELLGQIRAGVNIDNFNPGSTHKVRDLLFERWKIEVPLEEKDRFTGSGDASTSDLVLRTVLTDRTVPKDQRELIKLIRYYRKIQKTLGTYVTKLRYTTNKIDEDLLWDDEDEEWADKEAREKYGLKKMGIVDPRTNRMHPGYSIVSPVTGRLSSSKPINAMNFPKALRSMITAKPGNLLVGADSEQIEVRVAASWWQVEKYLLAFREGKDVHSMSTFMIFGDAFCKVAGIAAHYFTGPGKLVGASYDEKGTFKGKGEAANLRKLGKITHLAAQYMAGTEQVHKILQSTEVPAQGPDGKDLDDGTTDLPYALMPLTRSRGMHEKWMEGAPEYKAGWERDINLFKRQGFLREPVNGRRRDFLDSLHGTPDDLAPNEIVNFSVQSMAAALISASMIQVYEQIPKNKWGPGTGIINQCHDHIVVECPESEAMWVKGVLEEAMNHSHPALPGVKFAATADIAKSWDKT